MWKILTVSLAICLPLLPATAAPLDEVDIHEYLSLLKDSSNGGLSSRIVGGVEVTPHSYPSQVALLIHKGRGPTEEIDFCAGSLVSKQWVLTAAQCLSRKHDYILVLLGTHNLTEKNPAPVMMLDAGYIYHKNYNPDTFQNDVGLLKLQSEVTLSDNIKLVTLAKGSERYDGAKGTIVGWGQTETQKLSHVLRKVEVSIITNDACAAASDSYKKLLQPTEVCTSGEGNVGACSRDTGGPLFVDDVQVGIASFEMTNCQSGIPSGFTRVNDYYDWIMDTMAGKRDTSDGDAPGGAAGLDSLRLGAIVLVALYFAQLLK